MIQLFAAFLFYSCLFSGVGRFFFGKQVDGSNYFIYPFLGIFFVSITLMLTSLVFPVNVVSLICFSLIGTFGIGQQLHDFMIKGLKSDVNRLALFGVIALLFTLIICYYLGYEFYPYATDTDMYHANAVRWLKEYGTVKGLANLHGRFGVNTSWHFIGALVDQCIWHSQSPWILPTLTYTLTLLYFTWEIIFRPNTWNVFYAVSIIAWTFCNIMTWGFPSLHYDFIALIYNTIVIHLVLSRTLDNSNYFPSVRLNLMLLACLATASFLLKPMGAVSIIFVALYILITLKEEKSLNLKNVIILSSLPALSFFLWIFRNIVLSGWPVFPSPVFPLDVSWLTPKRITDMTYKDILYWARYPEPNYMAAEGKPFLFWFKPWLSRQFHSIRFWFIAIIPFTIGSIAWILNFKNLIKKKQFFFFCWTALSLTFWFYVAPDIRFGDGFFFAYMTSAVSWLIVDNKERWLKTLTFLNSTLIGLSLLAGITLAISAVLVMKKRGPVNLFAIGRHHTGPVQKYEIRNDIGEIEVEAWHPITVSHCQQPKDNMICPENLSLYRDITYCGNSILPCTPYYEKDLRLYQRGNLGSGFYMFKEN